MKKLLLAALLLVLLIGISYVKVIHGENRLESAEYTGRKQAAAELMIARAALDSLRTELGETEVAYADSLVRKDQRLSVTQDSLLGLIDSLEDRIAHLETDVKQAKATARKAEQKAANAGPSREEQIITYYKKRYRGLPSDLSEYEQKVALTEIRKETAAKYNISLSELTRLRSRYRLDY